MTAEPHPVTLAAKRACCAAAAAAIAAAATNPVETLRVKWQVLKPAEKSVLAFATRLAEREGFARGLALPGLGAWMVAMGGAFGGRMVLYEPVRVGLEGVAGSSPATASVAGFGTGMLSNGLMCPFFACKTRLQVRSGGAGSMLPELAALWGDGGFRGLYAGVSALVVRGGLISAGQLGGYDFGKRTLRSRGMTEGPAFHLICSLIAAASAAALSTPPDVVLNRYQGDSVLEVRHHSVASCAASIVRQEGILALWRGVGPNFAKIAPVFLVTLPLFEQLRRLVGLGYLR